MKNLSDQFIANRVDAFWSCDSELVWIDWILSNVHKEHKLIALDKAVEIQNQNLVLNQREIQTYKQRLLENKQNYMSNNELELSQGIIVSKLLFNFVVFCLISKQFLVNEEISKIFNQIRSIITQREQEIRESVSQSFEQMKSLQAGNINKIASQLNRIQQFENIHSLKTKENHRDVVKYLQNWRLREELYTNAIAQIEIDEFGSIFDFNATSEIENICKLIASCSPSEQTSWKYEICNNKNVANSKKTFYNRPMPKSSNNCTKSSIPRIQSNILYWIFCLFKNYW